MTSSVARVCHVSSSTRSSDRHATSSPPNAQPSSSALALTGPLLETLACQDPSGDIARNARQILHGIYPSHLRRYDSAADAVSASHSRAQRTSGCVFINANSELAVADAISSHVLPWLVRSGYDAWNDVQVRARPPPPPTTRREQLATISKRA
jgi:hypothetical protein